MVTGGSMGDEKSQNFALMQVFRGSASATKVADNSFVRGYFFLSWSRIIHTLIPNCNSKPTAEGLTKQL